MACPKRNAEEFVDEPGRTLDYVVAIVTGIGCIFLVAGNVIIIKNRKYVPIKQRGVHLTVLSSIGGLIWIAAELVVQNHFNRNHPVFKNCSLWTFWLQACFGFALFLNCLTVRMFQLYHVLVRKKALPRHKRLKLTILPLMVLLSPTILLCILASILKGVRRAQPEFCRIHSPFPILLLLLLPLYFIIFIFFAASLRNVMSQWNEFRQIRIGGIMSIFIFLLSVVTLVTRTYTKVLGRCFLSFAVAGVVFYYFWARNWELVYNVVFHKEQYLTRFGEELNRFDDTSNIPPQRQQEVDSMDRLVLVTRDEARQKRETLETLEQEIDVLLNEVETLRHRHCLISY